MILISAISINPYNQCLVLTLQSRSLIWHTHTSTLRDVLGPCNALGFGSGTRLTGQLTLCVLIGSGWTLDTPVLLAAVERPYTTADWETHSTVIRSVFSHETNQRTLKVARRNFLKPTNRQKQPGWLKHTTSLMFNNAYHTFPWWGPDPCYSSRLSPVDGRHVAPPRTLSLKTGYRTAA